MGRPAVDAPETSVSAALEAVPLAILTLDDNDLVSGANAAARSFFQIDEARLPLSVIEATREVRMEEAIAAASAGPVEVRLVHRPSSVLVQLAEEKPNRFIVVTDLTELRRLESVRQEFIANLSHELRTPLASLRLAAETLQGGPPPEAARRFAQRVVDEASHLQDILDNLGQLTEIEAGRLQLTLVEFNLRELVEEVSARSRLDGPLELHIDPELGMVADRSKIAQVLSNLFDNAKKFAPAGTPIEVSAQAGDGQVTIAVRDHGPGISPEHWDKVFERFYKVDPARSRDLSGSGLGLAITKHLVQAHGGSVATQAAEEGGGQVFTVSLPHRTFTPR